MSDQNPEVSRRDLIRIGAITLTTLGAGVVSADGAEHVHHVVTAAKKSTQGPYQPKLLTASEHKTLERLCDLIIPADDHSAGALAGDAPEFIDFFFFNATAPTEIYTGGL